MQCLIANKLPNLNKICQRLLGVQVTFSNRSWVSITSRVSKYKPGGSRQLVPIEAGGLH